MNHPPFTANNADAGAGVEVMLGPGWGWSHHQLGTTRVDVRGYLFCGERTLVGESAARHAATLLAAHNTDDATRRALATLAGHFALVVRDGQRVIATVDRIRSIPLLHGQRDDRLLIDDRGRRLRDRLGLGQAQVSAEQALAVAMSGNSIGAGTLYDGLLQLRAGEALVVDRQGARTLRWFIYDAWRSHSIADPEQRLGELHRLLMERLAASAEGRTIAVPLSAGLDSRMVASGLKAVGYRNVRTFSYGRPGNFEAATARAVAQRLGYPWTFVAHTTRGQRAMFADPEHERRLWHEADDCGAVPFEQDWTAVATLRRSGWLPADSIVVNGQSGDYITGNHAPAALMNIDPGLHQQARRTLVVDTYVRKHMRLWRGLAGSANDARVAAMLAVEAEAAGASFASDQTLSGIHEMLEYQDRQAKYVVSGQRTYEALGLDWRLPLWDDEYVEFWRHCNHEFKRGQSLYRRLLQQDNWGNVWHDIPVNAKTIRPRWIIPLRWIGKAVHLPLGAARWHEFERRVFGWWMDGQRMSAVIPYSQALRSGTGARHAVAWLTRRYLAQHGLQFDGSVPASTSKGSR
jgi:asparagine synthase (glutamine-hydrolysing)